MESPRLPKGEEKAETLTAPLKVERHLPGGLGLAMLLAGSLLPGLLAKHVRTQGSGVALAALRSLEGGEAFEAERVPRRLTF